MAKQGKRNRQREIGKRNRSTAKQPLKNPTKKATKAPAKPAKNDRKKPRKVTGTVRKVVNGKPTDEMLTAEEAFNDSQQAVEQVLFAERHGSQEEIRLVRLAYRQYQKKRFRSK